MSIEETQQWEMSPSGLYADYESAFSALAMELNGYLDARERAASAGSGEMSSGDFLALIKSSLEKPLESYAEFLRRARPAEAEEILKKSDGKAVLRVDAAIRTFNGVRFVYLRAIERGSSLTKLDLLDIAQSLDTLYKIVRGDAPSFADRVIRLSGETV